MSDRIEKLAEEIAWLDTDQLWALATHLVDNYKVPAYCSIAVRDSRRIYTLKIEFAEKDLDYKD